MARNTAVMQLFLLGYTRDVPSQAATLVAAAATPVLYTATRGMHRLGLRALVGRVRFADPVERRWSAGVSKIGDYRVAMPCHATVAVVHAARRSPCGNRSS